MLHRVEWLYEAIRIGGAVYLVYFGFKLPRVPHARNYLRTYRSGLLTCLTNPKSCVFWAMLPAHVPL